VNAVRQLIARAVPAAAESVKWNAPSFALADHFATFHLRGTEGVQLVLHLGARARPGVDLRTDAGLRSRLLQWKGPDRAIVTVPDIGVLKTMRAELAAVLKAWSRYVGTQRA
jgi:hypothetical protein